MSILTTVMSEASAYVATAPIVYHPDLEVFLAAGFYISPLEKGLILPPGWKIHRIGTTQHSRIVDAAERQRAWLINDSDRNGTDYVKLLPRFTWDAVYATPRTRVEPIAYAIYDADQEILRFGEGEIVTIKQAGLSASIASENVVRGQVRQWFAEHRPDHADPTAYWDESQQENGNAATEA
jgi:hypothetical protein